MDSSLDVLIGGVLSDLLFAFLLAENLITDNGDLLSDSPWTAVGHEFSP